jgi:uncharacterized membrane protein YvbJ
MYCVKCGKEIEEGSKFCRHCGAEIPEKGTVQAKKSQEIKKTVDLYG